MASPPSLTFAQGVHACLFLDSDGKAELLEFEGYTVGPFFVTRNRTPDRQVKAVLARGWNVYHLPSTMKVTNKVFTLRDPAVMFAHRLIDLTPEIDWNFRPDYLLYKIGDLDDFLDLGKSVRAALRYVEEVEREALR